MANKLIGILYQKEGCFFLHSEDLLASDVSLDSTLQRIEGEEVKFRLSSDPSGCRWGSSGLCPAGHTEAPDLAMLFQHRGVLTRKQRAWHIGDKEVPFQLFEGHVCQLDVFPSEGALRERILRIQFALRQVRDI